jgi:RHS repeat-associated protein
MPLQVEDDEGRIVWWADRIHPFGRVDVGRGATIEYNLRWPGHYFDPETGLHCNRFRVYDPGLARYLQGDPIGYKGSPVNLYAYCSNPLVDVDVLGLAPCKLDPPGGSDDEEPAPTPKEDTPEEEPGPQLSQGAQLAQAAGLPDAPEGYHWADVGGQPRVRANPGSENPPIFYNDQAGDFQERPPADAYPRVGFTPSERADVFESGRGEDGEVRCPCGEPIASSSGEDMNMGHKPGHDYATARDQAIADQTPRSDFRDDQKNLSNYRPEHPSCNQSHAFETETPPPSEPTTE